jgi:hypothetical protein
MFEQELYNAPEPVNSQEGDLFHNYEIKNWEIGPRIYKILAFSAIFNIAALAFVAQSDLLTRKGCDSPWAGRVCQVLDMAYVGTMLFGTERDYVDQEYEKIELGDAEITFIDANLVTPPMDYPEGYFQIANPEQFALLKQMQENGGFTSGFNALPPPVSSGSDLLAKAPDLPKPNPNAVTGEVPDSPFSVSESPDTTAKQRFGTGRNRKKPAANTNVDPDESVAQSNSNTNTEPVPTPLTSEAVKAVVINKQPLRDFADDVAAKWSAKTVDLNKPVNIVLNAVIKDDGLLDKDKSKFDPSKQTGDPQMADVAKSAFEALGASGFLYYLKAAGIDRFTATLTQNDEGIALNITSPQRSEERAKSTSSLVSGYLVIGRMSVGNPSDELTLLDAAKTTTDGKNFVLNFALPKSFAQELINRKLQEAQASKTQPSSENLKVAPDKFAR